MAAPCQPCDVGLSWCHLRRISSRASVSDIADVIHFWKTVTLIGRNRDDVDYFLSCVTPRGSDYISRIHARVIRTSAYELVDSSLTGVYVNDVRMDDRIFLQEGDTVIFGHPAGQSVDTGVRARQPNSPFYFLFEHCHCRPEQMQQLPGEFPVLAAAGASPEIRWGLCLEMKAALPQRACAAPGLLPAHPALSELNAPRGRCCPAAFCTLTPPLPSAASVCPPVASSPSADSVNVSSNVLKMLGDPGPGASPDSALESSVRSGSRIRRSLSPEYAVLEEETPGTTEPSSWEALEMKCRSFIPENPKLNCPDPTGGRKELPVGCRPGCRGLFPQESCSGEAGTCPVPGAWRDPLHPSLPASARPDESVAADLSSSQCGSQVGLAVLPRDEPQHACSFQAEEGDSPEPGVSLPGAEDPASGGSDPSQEVMRMEVDENTGGTAQSNTTCLSDPGAQEQVPELVEEAVSGDPVTSAGCARDSGLGEEGTLEGHGEILMEKPLREAGLPEAERAADGSVTDNSLTNKADTRAPETLDLLSDNSGSGIPDDLPCGQEPDGALPASLEIAKEIDPEALSTPVPCKIQGGRDACEADAEDDGHVEMFSHRLLATGCPLGPRGMGSVEPEVASRAAADASVGELSFAQVGTQTGGTKEREMGPVVTEAGEERGTSRVSAVLQHHGSGINAHLAKETVLQQLSIASASDFPTCEVSSKGEFSREGTITAAASSGVTQGDSSSEDLLETCNEDTAWVAAAPPAGLVLEKGIVLQELLEADLPEQPMDLDGKRFEECQSQRSATCTEGEQEGAAAEREPGPGSPRWTKPDPSAESQLPACRLGHEEERHKGDSVAPIPVCASPAEHTGGREPDPLCGHESEGQEEAGRDGASGGGESEAPRGRSIASGFPAGTAVGEGGLENPPERALGQPSSAGQVSSGSTGSALARRLEGDVACPLAASACGHARLLPPFQLSSNTLEEEGIPHSEDLGAGAPLLLQRSETDAGGRWEPENSRLLPKQDDTEDEQEADLNNEIRATAQSCSVDAEPIEDAQQHQETAEPEQKDSRMERWADRRESCGVSSGPSTPLGSQADFPLPQDCQEPELHAGEPQGLENDPEMEPHEASVGKGSFPPRDLPVESGACAEVCQPDVTVECPAPTSPEGCREEAVVPEQGRGWEQSPKDSSCGEEKGKGSRGLCTAGSERSRALQGSTARQSLGGDSEVVLEPSSSDGLDLCMSDSAAEREEENDNSQVHSTCSREAAILRERDALIPDSVEHLGGITEGSEACGKLAEPWATRDQDRAASQETGDSPPKATDTLAQQNSPSYEPSCGLGSAAVAAPETSITDMAAGRKPPALVEAAVAGEELEDQAAEGANIVPLDLSRVSEESNAKLGEEDQALGGASGVAEEVGPDQLEDKGRLDSRFADQPGEETLEVGESPEEHLQSESPASICAEEVEGAWKTKEDAPLCLQQGMGTQQPQETTSRSEDHPGCSMRLESPEHDRSPVPEEEEEESEGCSSRKRHFSEDRALEVVDWEQHDSYGQKRLRPLDSGPDLHSTNKMLSAPLDLESQFSRTIGEFLQQFSSQIILPSEETEEKNRDSIAQIVRTYFNGVFGPEEPEAENLEVEMSALPLEARMPEGEDCQAAAGSATESRAAGEGTEASLTLSAGPQVDPVKCQDPSLPRECSSPSTASRSSGSDSPHPEDELAHHVPESGWEADFSEEEEFQSSISSVLDHSLLNSPVASPEPRGKNVDLVFSDISNSSAETEHCEPPPQLQVGSEQLDGTFSEAAEVDLATGGACRSPEPADVGWRKEESSAPSGKCLSSHESIQTPEADWLAEPEDQLNALGENTGAPVLRQAGGPFGGEEGFEWDASCTSSPAGEAGEELDDGASQMETGDGPFLRRSHEHSPSQALECKPAIHQPSDSTLGGRRAPCVKAEPAPCHARELLDEDGSASPSRAASLVVTSESVVCPTAVDTRGEDSTLRSPSLSRATPTPVCSQARNSSLLNGSCLLGSLMQDGCAKAAAADVREKLQGGEDVSSLCPLPPGGPAGVADDPEEEDFGGGLESDLGRSGARWAGQTSTPSAAQGDAGDVGRRAVPLPAVAGCGNPMPACNSLVQENASVSIQLPGLPSVSRVIKEEPDPCDPHVQVAGCSPGEAYPTACSPVIPVLQKSRIAEASGNWVPESPVSCNKKEWLLGEAEAFGQLGAACLPSGSKHAPGPEAQEGRSSASTASPAAPDPPPRGDPWSGGDGSARNTSTSNAGGAESSSPGKHWASSEHEVAFQLQECQSVLEEISRSLCAIKGIEDRHMEKWREQIAELQKATKMPKTHIAVVGNTGAGKSSLLNALLDEEAVLPTSAMRACTAVVVEISRAAGGSRYEADVEFLSKEEWYKELTALLEDMKDKSGNLQKRCPDRKTEARAAYCRVKAVYGRVDEIAKLESVQDVTQHLGTVKRISAEMAAEFCVKIEKFIDSRTDNLRDLKGGEFWPIVKCVKIRVAQAEVLKTGVVLVDLPGVRDSNAARDHAAKEYLKNCNAVWVVASITRAVDDKTAKEILNSSLRRQLFMDGQYGNLAFICTKTDSFNISDIVRNLNLRKEIRPLEEDLEELESQRVQAEEEKKTLHVALQLEQRPGVEAADPAWLQREPSFLEKEFRLSALQKQKDAKLRAISLVCVQARNRFSKQRIRMDFNSDLEELKRKAEFSECDDDDDEDMEDGDSARSDPGDLGEAESQPEKLHVFTVSSTEYLKLSGKLLRDGPAQVFHDPKDTEIPALKNFAIETGLKTSMKAAEKVVRDVARIISQIVHYLTNQRAEDHSHQAQAQELLQQALQGLPRFLQEAADAVLPGIQYLFRVQLQSSLSRGSNKAKELCETTVKSWGLPGSGLPHATYHAVCVRWGVYTSQTLGSVDFNIALGQPLHDALTGAWNEVFNFKLEESLQCFTEAVLDKLKFFFRELKTNVGNQSSLTEALHALHLQQTEAVRARLRNFFLDQEAYISQRQRTISRMLIPAIQAGMEPAYAACSRMSGPGYFRKMKEEMEHYVRDHKDYIFDAAARKLQEQLHLLQQDIQANFGSLLRELNKSLKMQFEPLLKPVQKSAEVIPDLMNICAKVDKICKRSGVKYVLPSASSLKTEGEPWGSPLRLSALCLDVRLGALPLPHIAAIQVSGQDLVLTLTDDGAVALPLRSVSRCESCPPLGCLILHVSSESAGEIRRRCRVPESSPGQHGREMLVILGEAQAQVLFSRLRASMSSSRRDALWVQTLSLGQGRERLKSLRMYDTPWQSASDAEQLLAVPAAASILPSLPQVISVVQQPQLPPVNLLPYGRKRAGEASSALLEKRCKSQAEPDPAGCPLPSWSTEGRTASSGQRAASCPLPASGVCFPGERGWKAGWLLGAAPHSTPAGERTARPGSAGAPVRAEEGFWGKCCDPNSQGGH